jgi:hypothetical protein
MATKEEKNKVDFNDKQTVYGTGGPNNTLEKGKEYVVHPVHAKTLIKLGRATEKPVK